MLILPAAAYNPDDGVGVGAFVGLRRAKPRLVAGVGASENGESLEAEPLGRRPWVWDFGAVGLGFFKPYPNGWSLSALASWFPEPSADTEWEYNLGIYGWLWDWWFGVGNDQPRDLRRQDPENDPVRDAWHRFGHYQVRASARIRQRVLGPFGLSIGLLLKWDVVDVRPGTLLEQDTRTGEAEGADGGPQVALEGALILDDRDDPQDPTRGYLLNAVGEGRLSPMGPSGRMILDMRGYLSPKQPVLVFAGQMIAQMHVGGIAFYDQGVIGGAEIRPRALTGVGGVRGLDRGRIRGPLGLVLHGELRFRPPPLALGELRVRVQPTLFVDGTRADTLELLGQGPPLHGSLGGGIRLVLQEQTVIRIDV
ncbi:MAG: hypothetical protein CL928_06270, partial [Deltaproteobacteria bacterium]|nr:hypothetical protein [Deltaproteobacteria bacterium]